MSRGLERERMMAASIWGHVRFARFPQRHALLFKFHQESLQINYFNKEQKDTKAEKKSEFPMKIFSQPVSLLICTVTNKTGEEFERTS